MKAPINFFHSLIGSFISNKMMINLFLQRWGTTYVNGIKVFNKEHLIYPVWFLDSNSNLVYLLKKMKMYDSLRSSVAGGMQGVEYMFLLINPSKVSGSSVFNDQLIVERLEELFDYQKTYVMNLNMDMPAGITTSTPKSQIMSIIGANWLEVLRTTSITTNDNDGINPEYDRYYKFVLFDYGNAQSERDFEFEMKNVSFGVRRELIESTDMYEKKTTAIRYINTLSIQIEFKRTASININSAIISSIKKPYDYIESADTDGSVSRTAAYFAEANATSELFYKGHLRADIFDESFIGFDNRLFNLLISKCLDTRYVEKKVEWWKKALVIVVAVAVFYFSGGFAANASAGIIAMAFTYTAIALAALSMYLAKNGEPGTAKYAAKGSKAAGVAAMITGVYAVVQQGWQAWVNSMTKSWVSMSQFGLQVINIVAPMYYKNQMDNINDDINSLNGQIEAQERAEIAMMDNDMPLAKTLTTEQMNPIVTQDQKFEVDYLYEGTGKWNDVLYEGGCNICRTSFYPSLITDKEKYS